MTVQIAENSPKNSPGAAYTTPRPLRWALIFSVPLLLMAVMLWSLRAAPVAQAESNSTVFVGCSGGQAPNFATIQAAVNEVGAGSSILICTGNYSESVNLSLMGTESSDTLGDITLRRAPGEAGPVLINPQVGAGIFITPGGIFTGNITLDGIDVTADNDTGIDFSGGAPFAGTVQGTTILSDVNASESFLNGAVIAAGGPVSVVNSLFNRNELGTGLEINVAQVLDGAVLSDIPTVYVDNVQANDNGSFGIYISTVENVDVLNSEAHRNGPTSAPGISGSGIHIEHRYLKGGPCVVFPTAISPRVNMAHSAADENQGYGVYIYSQFDVFISHTTVFSNAYDGLAAYAGLGCDSNIVRLEESTAEYNGLSAAYSGAVTAGEGDVAAQGATLYLPFGGFRLASSDKIQVLNNNVTEENEHFGYCITGYSSGQTIVQDSLAEGNIGDGFLFDPSCAEAFYAFREFGDESESFVATDFPQPQVIVSNTTAISNSAAGFTFTVGGNAITVTNVSALGNQDGLVFTQEPKYLATVNASIVTDLSAPILFPPVVSDSLIQSNSRYGVLYNQIIGYEYIYPVAVDSNAVATQTYTSTATIDSSIICENGTGLAATQGILVIDIIGEASVQNGLVDAYKLFVDARGNWWGAFSGPTTPENPGGTGDSIVEDPAVLPFAVEGGNEADVQFAPWINTLHASAVPSPTVVGVPVNVEYQFSDAALAYFLQNGVGNLNDEPIFALSSSNGDFAGGDPVKKFIVASLLDGVFTPTAAGVATVQLDGPCDLDKTLLVPVAQPAISIEKLPGSQQRLAGTNAVFNIEVKNTGNITLTNITVSDPNAPNCSRAVNALGNLGISASANYTCSVTVNNNLLNTISVSGQALVGGVGAGATVNDSANANVVIVQPAISVDKQPAIQGVAPGTNALFTITVRNTGSITLTDVSVSDPIAPNCARAVGALGDLGIGAGQTYACSLLVNNNLINEVTARGKALIDGQPTGSEVSDTASAEVLVAGISLTKTVFVDGFREKIGPGAFNPSDCALASTITVPVTTTVKFCYTVTNTGDVTISRHSLVDSVLGSIFADIAVDLAPGASYSTVDAEVFPTQTLTISTTNVATWTGELAPPVVSVDAVDAVVTVVASNAATVNISGDTLDQDLDSIPDNIEGSGDLDADGIPDFLDPDAPTGLEEGDQPNLPSKIFLPSINR